MERETPACPPPSRYPWVGWSAAKPWRPSATPASICQGDAECSQEQAVSAFYSQLVLHLLPEEEYQQAHVPAFFSQQEVLMLWVACGAAAAVARGQFSEASDGSDPSVSVCFVVQNRTAVHDQQAQPRTERPRRRGGGRPERALRGPSPRERAVHGETRVSQQVSPGSRCSASGRPRAPTQPHCKTEVEAVTVWDKKVTWKVFTSALQNCQSSCCQKQKPLRSAK